MDNKNDFILKEQTHELETTGVGKDVQGITKTASEYPEDNTKRLKTYSFSNKDSRHSWFKIVQNVVSFLANIAVIVGIGFAFLQIIQSDRSERRRLAIEGVSQTRSGDFLKAYANLKASYKNGQIQGGDSLITDINYVMNVYDHIALLYINNLADRCIIKNSIYHAVKEIIPICDAMQYPEGYRRNIDLLLSLMEQERCK